MATERECLEALGRAAEQLGEPPTKAQYEQLGLTPASATIIRTCGGWNEAKRTAGLETSPSSGSRVSPEPEDVDIPEGTSWEDLTVDQRWHYRNVEWNTERSLRRRSRLRAWLNQLKRKRGCPRCDVESPTCLEFHHVDETTKEMAVGRMITYGYGKDKLRDEIEKCVVLCANCHRRAHFKPPKGDRRQWLHEQKRKANGCTTCSEKDPATLDFHHTAEVKADTVSILVSDNRPKRTIRKEIRRCILLWANCHRKEHHTPPGREIS